MLTIFDILPFAGVVAGATFGYRLGVGIGGTVGGVLGLIAGIAVGWIVGRLPFAVSLWSLQRSLKRASAADLRSRLEREYFISHLIIAELVTRGEPIESFRSIVEGQLASQSADEKRFGRANAQVWFPELAGSSSAGNQSTVRYIPTIATSTDTVIASLESFVAKDDGGDEETLYNMIEGFNALPDRARVLPAMFAVMERHPEADLGSPGPLVHSIEQLPTEEYQPLLLSSVERQPGQLNVWMVNRILNSQIPAQQREELLALVKRVTSHPRASQTIRELAEGFLKHQAGVRRVG